MHYGGHANPIKTDKASSKVFEHFLPTVQNFVSSFSDNKAVERLDTSARCTIYDVPFTTPACANMELTSSI
jgi:hypothetical protein